MLAGGVFTPLDLAAAAADAARTGRLGRPLFVQLSDTHIGFNKEANPDVTATLTRAVDLVNAMPEAPALVIQLQHVHERDEVNARMGEPRR